MGELEFLNFIKDLGFGTGATIPLFAYVWLTWKRREQAKDDQTKQNEAKAKEKAKAEQEFQTKHKEYSDRLAEVLAIVKELKASADKEALRREVEREAKDK